MRNISFALTTAQIKARSKTVTRRTGWAYLKPGERLQACVKCMGRKRGEPLERLCAIEVVSVRRERLDAITDAECVLEGLPHLDARRFVAFFCESHRGCRPESNVTRIEFRYI